MRLTAENYEELKRLIGEDKVVNEVYRREEPRNPYSRKCETVEDYLGFLLSRCQSYEIQGFHSGMRNAIRRVWDLIPDYIAYGLPHANTVCLGSRNVVHCGCREECCLCGMKNPLYEEGEENHEGEEKKEAKWEPPSEESIEEANKIAREHNKIWPHFNRSEKEDIENHLAEICQLVSYLPKKQREDIGQYINCSVRHIWKLLPKKFKNTKKYDKAKTTSEK